MLLKNEDIELMEKRQEIEAYIEEEQWEEAKKSIKAYGKNDFVSVTKKLHEQYMDFMEATIFYQKMELEKAMEKLRKGIKRTNPKLLDILDGKKKDAELLLSMIEMKQFCMYCEILEKQEQSRETTEKLWIWIRDYLLKHVEDTEYQMEFYPVILYHIAVGFQEKKQWLQCLSSCEEGIEFLKKYKSLLCLKEFLKLHIEVSKQVGMAEKKENIEYLEMLSFIEEHILKEYSNEKRLHLGGYFIGDVIKNTREYIGKTQEELNDVKENGKGVADPSTLSKIENGRRNPRRTTCEYYFQKLGLGDYQIELTPVVGDSFQVQQLRWNIDHMLSENQFEKAASYLKQLEKLLDQKKAINKQYVQRVKGVLDYYYRRKITVTQYRERLIRLLKMTWKDFDVEDTRKLTRFLNRVEITILINIAQCYKDERDYKRAIEIYDRLKYYFEEVYPMAGYSNYSILCYSMEQTLGLSGAYEESIDLIKKEMNLHYFYRNGYWLDKHFYNMGWNYGKMMLDSKDEVKQKQYKKACQIYLKQALKGAIFMEDKRIVQLINEKETLWF